MTDRVLGGGARREQKAWLTSELQRSGADWKVVLGHHPVYSGGSHGNTEELLDELDPLLRKYGAHIYFSGHDHNKQFIQHQGMNYIISGAGGKYSTSRTDEFPKNSLRHRFEDPGFAGLSICSKSSATLTFYDDRGRVQASESLPNAASLVSTGLEGRATFTPAGNVCGGVSLKNVDLQCRSGDGCKAVADQPSNKTCGDFCISNGLTCIGGWTENDEDCIAVREVGCHVNGQSTQNLICQCSPQAQH